MDIVKADYVRETVQTLVDRMGFPAHVSLREPVCEGQGDFICTIRVEEDSNLLIGQHGVNLQALQHIVRLLAKRHFQENGAFSLDVNAYWEQKSQALVKEARNAAGEAIKTQSAVAMRPMAGYERKIIHAELAANDRVVTESAGLDEYRKVIIKPVATENTIIAVSEAHRVKMP
jgi:spoIIIJ-associated protein